MVISRRLRLALLFSLLMHLALLNSPGWRLPTLDDLLNPEAQPSLEAHLSSPAAHRKTVVPGPKPRPASKQRQTVPAKVSAQDSATLLYPQPAPAAVLQPEPIPAPVSPVGQEKAPEPAEPVLPRQGRIRFAVIRGDQDFVVGQAVHSWSRDDGSYTLKNVTETTGLVAVFRPARVAQTSEGAIVAGPEGLRPRSFRTERNGTQGEMASFDWTAMKLQLTAGGSREVALATGAQDMLSMFYQLGALAPRGRTEIMVTTGRKFERYAFEVIGEEKLPTRFGEMRALHLRTAVAGSSEATEVWLALDRHGLPLKIRYIDRSGDSFDQIAEEIEIDGQSMTILSPATQPPAMGQ